MKIKNLWFATCLAASSQLVIADSTPPIADINSKVFSPQSESTFYQPDFSEKRYSVIGDTAIIEGDIAVGKHEHVQSYGIGNLAVLDVNADNGDGITANAAWSGATTWPNSTVPYVISSASQPDQGVILEGMAAISDVTGVQFVPRTNEADYIEVVKSTGCWSHVGRIGGRQELSIGNGCAYRNTVAHEFIHALGFWHEQSRADRDNYVQINWENIPSGNQHNFDTHGAVTTTVGSYDPYSIMHYGYKAFSNNGLPTIESLIPGVPSSQLGQGNGLTDTDVAGIIEIYGSGDNGGGGTSDPSYGPLTLYEHCDFDGWETGIPPLGGLALSDLNQYDFVDNQLSSFNLAPGFAVRFYDGANLDGNSHAATSSDNCLANNGFNDNVSSIYLRADGDTGLSGTYYLRNRNSGLYMDVANSETNDGANILQWHLTNAENQQFEFIHQGDGAYTIRNVNSNKAVDVNNAGHSNGENIKQWSDVGALQQRFVARPVNGGQHYQLIAMHSGKSLKIAGGSTDPSANVEQWQNDNQLSSHWELIPVNGGSGGGPSVDITTEAEDYSNMSGIQTETTQDPEGGNLNVGWIDANDWMAYSNITIPETGSYTIEYRIASPNGAELSLDINGGSQTLGTRTIPSTGGWQNWQTISHTVDIPEGTHSFGIFAPAGGWNINWFRITSN